MRWIKISLPNQLQNNELCRLDIEGKKVCMARYKEKLMAISDRCTHNGESLSKGRLNAFAEVVCPLHGYRFRLLDGRCSEPSPDAEVYPVKEENDEIFIAL